MKMVQLCIGILVLAGCKSVDQSSTLESPIQVDVRGKSYCNWVDSFVSRGKVQQCYVFETSSTGFRTRSALEKPPSPFTYTIKDAAVQIDTPPGELEHKLYLDGDSIQEWIKGDKYKLQTPEAVEANQHPINLRCVGLYNVNRTFRFTTEEEVVDITQHAVKRKYTARMRNGSPHVAIYLSDREHEDYLFEDKELVPMRSNRYQDIFKCF